MPHTQKFFYPKLLSLSTKVFSDVGSILITIQRESEKMIWKADFEWKILQRVRS